MWKNRIFGLFHGIQLCPNARSREYFALMREFSKRHAVWGADFTDKTQKTVSLLEINRGPRGWGYELEMHRPKKWRVKSNDNVTEAVTVLSKDNVTERPTSFG